jgi:hypothetical protein
MHSRRGIKISKIIIIIIIIIIISGIYVLQMSTLIPSVSISQVGKTDVRQQKLMSIMKEPVIANDSAVNVKRIRRFIKYIQTCFLN